MLSDKTVDGGDDAFNTFFNETGAGKFFLNNRFYFLLINYEKKKKKDLTAPLNRCLRKYYIDKNWNLKDWNDKTES